MRRERDDAPIDHMLGCPAGRWERAVFCFSSRRRHTRCSRDWSSDVCSSDLDLRITREMVLPDGVTDDYHCSAGAQRSFFRKKSAAENRVDAENIKIISGGQSPVNALGLRDAGERHVVIVIAEKSGKSLRALAEVTKVGIRKWRGGVVGAVGALKGEKGVRVGRCPAPGQGRSADATR